MIPLRVLMAHNYYQQPGGEDVVFAAEKDLLRSRGHEVIEYTDTNARLDGMNRFKAAKETIWSVPSYRAIKKIILEKKPDVVHFHNTFLMISPSTYYACREEGVPVVQTLHNYRLLCPAATFYRDSGVCELCLGRLFAFPGVLHACYRNSTTQSTGVAAMISLHKILGTWKNLVNVYIALTDFSRRKFIAGGLPPSKIIVKPNFIALDIGFGTAGGDFALFVGRLSGEKGVLTMLKAWKTLLSPVPLKIVGDGPLRGEVLKFIDDNPLVGVEYLGAVAHDQVVFLMKAARFLVFPSEWYEGFPMVIGESFACGLPVICSAVGSMMEIVKDKVVGIFFSCGNSDDLAEKVSWLWNHPKNLNAWDTMHAGNMSKNILLSGIISC